MVRKSAKRYTEDEYIALAKDRLFKDIDFELSELIEKDKRNELKRLAKKLRLQFSNIYKTLDEIKRLFPKHMSLNLSTYLPLQKLHPKLFNICDEIEHQSTGFSYDVPYWENRIPPKIASDLLEIIFVCERDGFDIEWLRDFLLSENGLNHYIRNHKLHPKANIKLATPSNDNTQYWLYKFKETLERNLFSYLSKKVKKLNDDEFLAEKERYYNDLRKDTSFQPFVFT